MELFARLEKLAAEHVTDADDSPIVWLMSMLRPMVESIRVACLGSPNQVQDNSQEEGVTGNTPASNASPT